MFERYTEAARRVVFFARYEASTLGSSSIDTGHLLLGLLREGRGATQKLLARSGYSYSGVRKEIEGEGPTGPASSTSVDMPLSPDAMRTLQHANEEADQLKAADIGVEHLLLGLLWEPESIAGAILASKGLRLDEVREEVRLLLGRETVPQGSSNAFQKLVAFLDELGKRGAVYYVTPFRAQGVRVEVALPQERWAATFLESGQVAVEMFGASGPVLDETALSQLLDRLGSGRDEA